MSHSSKKNRDLFQKTKTEQKHTLKNANPNKESRHPLIYYGLAFFAILMILIASVPLIRARFFTERSDRIYRADLNTIKSIKPYLLSSKPLSLRVEYPDEQEYWDEKKGQWKEGYEEALAQWEDDQQSRKKLAQEYQGAYRKFVTTSIPVMIPDGQENSLISPLNLYLAMGMLAETTAGDSREELLHALQQSDIESVRNAASALWERNFQNDGRSTLILGNSLWLRKGEKYIQDTISQLAFEYHADVFSGDMTDPNYSNALRFWLNSKTNQVLSDRTEEKKFAPEDVFSLISAIYLRTPWEQAFEMSATQDGIFHGISGDHTVPFMQETQQGIYYEGNGYTAVRKKLQGGAMYFLLPEGKSVAELSQSGAWCDLLFSPDKGKQKSASIRLVLPKFDVTADLNMMDAMKKIGVEKIFQEGNADFSSMVQSDSPLIVSEFQHSAGAHVNETGVEAAAFTQIRVVATAAPVKEESIEFRLDRPFLYVIVNDEGDPIFVGTVNSL